MSRLLILLCITIFLPACEENDSSKGEKPDSLRTILVYMGGKNNLSGETYQKIEALRLGWQENTPGNLLIYHAPSDGMPKLLEIVWEDGEKVVKTVEEYTKENSADPEIFGRVVNTVLEKYPSPSYGLIIFSHASGWLPPKTLTTPRSVIIDTSREMELSDMANALPDNIFEFIIFEMCFMAGIEVAYEFQDKADYILASSAEILSPGFTSLYRQGIRYLYNPTPDLNQFVIKGFNYFNSLNGDNCSSTLSIIRTAPLKSLAGFLKQNIVDTEEIDLWDIQHFDRYSSYRLFFDFGDYYSRLLNNEENKIMFSNLLESCIYTKTATSTFMPYTGGFSISRHSGMTTYIMQQEFPYLNEEYKNLRWYKDVFE